MKTREQLSLTKDELAICAACIYGDRYGVFCKANKMKVCGKAGIKEFFIPRRIVRRQLNIRREYETR